MLSVSSDKYTIPYLVRSSNGMRAWQMKSLKGRDMLAAIDFNYTFKLYDFGRVADRMTFHYCKSSVKPNARTLRRYGADGLSRVVSILSKTTSSNVEDANVALANAIREVSNFDLYNVAEASDAF